LSLATLATPLWAEDTALTGNWITPGHSIVSVYPCGPQRVCAKLVWIRDSAAKDDNNPTESLRARPLCGLQIGSDFGMTDATHAKNGRIYDPDSGNTYTASMVASDSELKVRGYVGVALLGRTEVWHRTQEPIEACTP
jgi:uncharacterized protein (DUF2147 family)